MKKLILLLLLSFVSLQITAQERWSRDPRTSSKPPVGKYQQLVSDSYNWTNTNTETRVIQTGQSFVIIFPNIRVLPNSNQQDEITMVRHPSNQNILFGGANTTAGGIFGQGGYISTNGGVTWTGNDLLPPFSQSSSDPGPTIDKNGVIIFTTLDNPGFTAAYSTNNGATWSSRITIASGNHDKNFAGTDDAVTSAFYGRSYAVWSNFGVGSPPAVISYTTNGGVSWSSMSQINSPPGGHYSQGTDIATGPNGEVYVCWAAPTSGSPFTEDFCGFAKSTNGGVSWTVTENAFDMNGIRANSFNGWNFRVNSFPRISVDRSGGSRNGWIYITTCDRSIAPAGTDADIVVHSSSNGGTTWSAGVRVNQDAMNNGKVQFFPAIRVDEAGGVNVVYYDNRNYPSVGDSCETYMSRSTDGGVTWYDILISDHRWRVKGEAGLGSYGGDYIGITSGNNKVYPFWFDDKTGTMQAWTAIVDLSLVGVQGNENGIPREFSLKQNYPNPFNPNTIIKFALAKGSDVKLVVYNSQGKEVKTLINSYRAAGNYDFNFNAAGLASGIYFYRLEAGSFTEVKKMMLVK